MEILTKKEILASYQNRKVPSYLTLNELTKNYTHFSQVQMKPEFLKYDLDLVFKNLNNNKAKIGPILKTDINEKSLQQRKIEKIIKETEVKEDKEEEKLIWLLFGGNIQQGPYNLEEVLKILKEKPDINFLIKNTTKKNQILTSGYFLDNYQTLTKPNHCEKKEYSEKDSISEDESIFSNNQVECKTKNNISENVSKSNYSSDVNNGYSFEHKITNNFNEPSQLNQNQNYYYNYLHFNNMNQNTTSFDNLEEKNFEKSQEDDKELFNLIDGKYSNLENSFAKNENEASQVFFNQNKQRTKKEKNLYLENFLLEQNKIQNNNVGYHNYNQISKNSMKNSKISDSLNEKNFIEFTLTADQIENEKKKKNIKNFDVDIFNNNEIIIPDSYFNKLHQKTDLCRCEVLIDNDEGSNHNFENSEHLNMWSDTNSNNKNPQELKNQKPIQNKKKLKKSSSNFEGFENFQDAHYQEKSKNENNFNYNNYNNNSISNYNNFKTFQNNTHLNLDVNYDEDDSENDYIENHNSKNTYNFHYSNSNQNIDIKNHYPKMKNIHPKNNFTPYQNNDLSKNKTNFQPKHYNNDFGQNLQYSSQKNFALHPNNFNPNYKRQNNPNFHPNTQNFNQNTQNFHQNQQHLYNQERNFNQKKNIPEQNFRQNYKQEFVQNTFNQNQEFKINNYKQDRRQNNYIQDFKQNHFIQDFTPQNPNNQVYRANKYNHDFRQSNINTKNLSNNLAPPQQTSMNYNSPYFTNNYQQLSNDQYNRGFENQNNFNSNFVQDQDDTNKKNKYKKKPFNPNQKGKVYVKRLNKLNEKNE